MWPENGCEAVSLSSIHPVLINWNRIPHIPMGNNKDKLLSDILTLLVRTSLRDDRTDRCVHHVVVDENSPKEATHSLIWFTTVLPSICLGLAANSPQNTINYRNVILNLISSDKHERKLLRSLFGNGDEEWSLDWNLVVCVSVINSK